MRAADLLAPYSFNSLRTIARTRGFRFDGLRRVDLIEAMAGSLFDPAELSRVIAGLHRHDSTVLAALSRLGGRASLGTLGKAVAEHGIDLSASSRPRESLDRIAPETRRFDEICARLTANGLLFSESEARAPLAVPLNLNPGATLVAPGAVLQALALHNAPTAPQEPPRLLLADGGSAWIEELWQYATLIGEQRLEVDPATGLLSPPSLGQVLEAFEADVAGRDESSFSRLWLLRCLLISLGIAQLRGGRLILQGGKGFFEHDRSERAVLLLAAYRREMAWVELRDLDLAIAPGWRDYLVASLLKQAGPDWQPVEVPPPPASEEEPWEIFTTAALLGPLRWFGLVDLELVDDHVGRSRWTDLGLFVAGRAPRLETIRGRLIVQPSFSILLLPPFDDATLARLDVIAERVRIGETAEWRLTHARWHAAIEQGHSATELAHWLAERGGTALPQNVSYTLAEWARLGRQAVLWETASVILGAPEELDRLSASPELSPLVVMRAAPDRLLLRDGAAVEKTLVALGETPLVQRYDRPFAGFSISVSEEGVISLVRRGAASGGNLLVPIALERFCRPLGGGRYQIDPDRLRHAIVQSPDGVTGILHFLRANARSLPPAIVTRLKVLGQPASLVIERPLLLRLPAEQLEILRSDPELAPLLGRQYAPGETVLEVADDDAELLWSLLGKRGIQL